MTNRISHPAASQSSPRPYPQGSQPARGRAEGGIPYELERTVCADCSRVLPSGRSGEQRRNARRAADVSRREAGPKREARSACAAIVSEGFVPRFALIAAPSTTWSPGSVQRGATGRRHRRRVRADGRPPRMCAVKGRFSSTSFSADPGTPPITSAAWRAASFASGIQVGGGSPPSRSFPAADRSTGAEARCRAPA